MKFITINGLQEVITLTGLKHQPQPIQEKLSRVELIQLLTSLPHNKLLKLNKPLISLQDMPTKPIKLSSKRLLLELQELIKLEVEPRTQEIQEDGELSGQQDH